jgi:hypothetical protein
MTPTFLYSLFFVSLGGIAAVFVSKMVFVEEFLRKKNLLMRPNMVNKKPELSGDLKIDQSAAVLNQTNAPWHKLILWIKNRAEDKKREKLKKIERKRVNQMKALSKDKISLLKKDDDSTSDDLKTDASNSQTVKPLPKKSNYVIEREETVLINRIALHPQNKKNYRILGNFYLKYGKLDDAKECFKHVLKIDSKDEYALEKMEQLKTR